MPPLSFSTFSILSFLIGGIIIFALEKTKKFLQEKSVKEIKKM